MVAIKDMVHELGDDAFIERTLRELAPIAMAVQVACMQKRHALDRARTRKGYRPHLGQSGNRAVHSRLPPLYHTCLYISHMSVYLMATYESSRVAANRAFS